MSSRSSVNSAATWSSGGCGFDSCLGQELKYVLCSLFHTSVIHLSHFITKLKIHHLYSLIAAYDNFDSADPSSMQGASHI